MARCTVPCETLSVSAFVSSLPSFTNAYGRGKANIVAIGSRSNRGDSANSLAGSHATKLEMPLRHRFLSTKINVPC